MEASTAKKSTGHCNLSYSAVLQNSNFDPSFPVVDENIFCPKEKEALRKLFDIPEHKRFILMAGAQNISDERKGGVYLKKALSLFWEGIDSSEREGTLMITVGNHENGSFWPADMDCRDMGYVSLSVLSDLYALSDVFLCPSIEDAGPMMVNQSLSCGTPVVMFQMGAAFDVIDGKGTGYCAKLRDVEDFCHGIRWVYELGQDKRAAISERCREVAMQTTSYHAFSDYVNNILHRQGYASR